MRAVRLGVVAIVAAAVLLTSCTGGDQQTPGTPSRTAESSSPASSPDGAESARSLPSKRPLQPVPEVRPDGMVDAPGSKLSDYRSQQVRWTDCSTRDLWLQCAEVLAPLDYEHPGRAAVTLTMRRRPSPSGDPQGALFVNPGGPGGSGVDFVAGFEPYGMQQRYDIIGWDPRGVGRSTPVRCFDDAEMETYTAADSSPDDPGELRAWEEINKRFGQACLQKSGALLEQMSTSVTVRDLELLRTLVGEDKLDYLGFSYGTTIGARYATMFPGRVGRMVLDGATDVGGGQREVSQAEGFNRTLGDFAQWCAEQGCRLGSSKQQVLAAVDDLLVRLDSDPLPAGRRDLTQALGVSGLVYGLYAPRSQWPDLASGLELAAFAGDGSAMLRWADSYNQRDDTGSFGQFNAAFPAIRCADVTDDGVAGAVEDWKKLSDRAEPLGAHFGPDLGCPMWPVPSSGDQRKPISYDGNRPVLIIGTKGDPATPYEYAEQMHEALVSSRLITLRAEGHLGFDQSECVRSVAVDYLMIRGTPQQDLTCAS